MSNYVSNYVYCCEDLYNDFLHKDFCNGLFEEGMYDMDGYELSDGRYLVIFDTRGMEYCTENINNVIRKYKDTIWYCMEENEVEEGSFWYANGKVCLSIRSLVEDIPDSLVEIKYANKSWATFRKLFINNRQIVVEDIINNNRIDYPLSADVGRKLSFLTKEKREHFQRIKNDTFAEFIMPESWPIWYSIRFYDGKDYYSVADFENCEDDYIRTYLGDVNTEEDAMYAEEALDFLEKFMKYNDIPIKIKYESLIDLVAK